MKDLIIWIVIWFVVWGTYNAYLRWKWEILKFKKYIPRGIFFLISTFVMIYFYNQLIGIYLFRLLYALIIINLIGLFLSTDRDYYLKFTKDRFFILFHSFNILFQQTSILIAMILFKNIIALEYKDVYFGIFFLAIHFPLAFLPWAKLKYWILTGCFFGGWLFSYLNFNFYYGIVFSFLIHYFLYVFEIYFLKDEEKI